MKTNFSFKYLWVILLFAVLHGLCCICCRSMGIDDARVLTLLTITMVFILAYQRKLKIYFIAAAIIITIVVAYLIGSALPILLTPLLGKTMWVNALSTTITTTLLGLLFELCTDLILRLSGNENSFKEAPQKKGLTCKVPCLSYPKIL